MLICVVVSINCVSTDSSKRFNYSNYTFNYSASKNVTINMDVETLGNTPIRIMESNSSNIGILIYYAWKPDVADSGDNNCRDINLKVIYPTDAMYVGADIFLYLPDNASYDITIYNLANNPSSIWKNGSNTTIGEFKGPIKIVVNNQTVIDKNDN